jgi:hypothetical protein
VGVGVDQPRHRDQSGPVDDRFGACVALVCGADVRDFVARDAERTVLDDAEIPAAEGE